jgi:hypothetical protein
LSIDLAVLDPNQVSGSTRFHHSRPEYPPQPRDVDLKRLASRCRSGLAPEHVDDPLRGDHLIGMQQEQAHEYRLAVPAELKRTTVAADMERSQNPKVHGAPL